MRPARQAPARVYRSTGKVWQAMNIGKAPGIPNNLIFSRAMHGQISGHGVGVVCQTSRGGRVLYFATLEPVMTHSSWITREPLSSCLRGQGPAASAWRQRLNRSCIYGNVVPLAASLSLSLSLSLEREREKTREACPWQGPRSVEPVAGHRPACHRPVEKVDQVMHMRAYTSSITHMLHCSVQAAATWETCAAAAGGSFATTAPA